MADIRRISPDDWQLLKSARLAALLDAPYAFGSTYAEEEVMEESDWRERIEKFPWCVAVEDGIGVGLIAIANFPPKSHHEVISMWVAPDSRWTNVASDLVSTIISWAKAEGLQEITLSVAEGNDRARRFYEKLGFTVTGNRKPLRSNPEIGIHELRKDI